jgi:hypothetical protein
MIQRHSGAGIAQPVQAPKPTPRRDLSMVLGSMERPATPSQIDIDAMFA